MSDISFNRRTGEAVQWDGKAWAPLETARNDQTGEVVALVGGQWQPIGEQMGASEKAQRVVGLAGKGFNEQVGAAIGAVPDLVTYGLRQFGKLDSALRPPSSIPPVNIPLPGPGFYGQQASAALNALGRNDTAETTTERAAYGAGQGAGNVASMLAPAGVVANMARPGSLAAGVAKTMTTQPAMQAVSGMTGGAVGEATENPALGLAAALAVPVGLGVARGVVSPGGARTNPETGRLAAVAQREGIPLTPGQITGSAPLRTTESVFGQLPSTAGKQATLNQTQREAFTRAALERMGVRGEKLATPEVLNRGLERATGNMQQVYARNNLSLDAPTMQRVQAIAAEAKRELPKDSVKPIVNRVLDFIDKIKTGPQGSTVDGKAFGALDSALSTELREIKDVKTLRFLGNLQRTLRDAFESSAPQADAELLREARRHFANGMVIQKAMNSGSANTAAGYIPPTALSSALAGGPRRNYARGFGDLNDLSRIGRAFVQDSVNDSGSAQRLMYQGLLTGAPAAALTGNTAAGLAAGAAGLAVPRAVQELYYSPAGRAYLTNQLADKVLPRVSPEALRAISATQARGLLD
jgi:hypothetical protein